MKKLGRNDLCWCGSGRKYKSCHMEMDEKIEHYALQGHIVPTHDMLKTPEQIEAALKREQGLNADIVEE